MTRRTFFSLANLTVADTCSAVVALTVNLGEVPMEHEPGCWCAEALTGKQESSGYERPIGLEAWNDWIAQCESTTAQVALSWSGPG